MPETDVRCLEKSSTNSFSSSTRIGDSFVSAVQEPGSMKTPVKSENHTWYRYLPTVRSTWEPKLKQNWLGGHPLLRAMEGPQLP